MRYYLLCLALIFISACKSSEKDEKFTAGTYEARDFHFSFDEPLSIGLQQVNSFDLDFDGSPDIEFIRIKSSGNIHDHLELYLKQSNEASSSWQFAANAYEDSIFLCKNPNQTLTAGLEYNLKSGYICQAPLDSLIQTGTFKNMYHRSGFGAKPEEISLWKDKVHFHLFSQYGGYYQKNFFIDYHPAGITESFFILKREYQGMKQYAWFKLRFQLDSQNRRKGSLYILEYAIQDLGSH